MGDLDARDMQFRVLRSGVGQPVTVHITYRPTRQTAEATDGNERLATQAALAILTRRVERREADGRPQQPGTGRHRAPQ